MLKMASAMKGLLKGLRYIARIFEDEKEPEIQIGEPTDVKHVAHIGWEGPSATTPSWMDDYKSPEDEEKRSSNKKPASSGESKKNKGRRKPSTGTNNSPADSPSRVGGSTRTSKRSTGKLREQSKGSGSESGSGLDVAQQNDQSVVQKSSRQKKSKGATTVKGGGGEPPLPVAPVEPKESDISVSAVYPCVGIESSAGR